MRILVVEDDKDVAGFVVRGLREAGHVVEHKDNGRDGLFMAASETFDVGVDLGSPVSLDYFDRAPFRFDGEIEKMIVELK